MGFQESPVLANTINHGKHQYTDSSVQLIKDYFLSHANVKDKKIEIVIGDSNQTISEFVKNNPTFRCDLISIDGGHFDSIPFYDLLNMAKLAREDGRTMLIVDDATCLLRGLANLINTGNKC